jgi:hypothetical protein
MLACMITGVPFEVDNPMREDDTIIVIQRGEIIGVLSEGGQEQVRTLRLAFTRDRPTELFNPLMGNCIETFKTYEPEG